MGYAMVDLLGLTDREMQGLVGKREKNESAQCLDPLEAFMVGGRPTLSSSVGGINLSNGCNALA